MFGHRRSFAPVLQGDLLALGTPEALGGRGPRMLARGALRSTLPVSERDMRRYTAGALPQMLPASLQRQMEALFGADFSDVRIVVSRAPDCLEARAFTWGSEIHIGRGFYHPTTRRGKALIAHELAHVLQQRDGRAAAAGAGLSMLYDLSLEREAEWMALRALRGDGPPRSAPPGPRRDTPTGAGERRGAALQPLRFSRFEGWSRLINWIYSSDEDELLKLERRVSAAHEALEQYMTERLEQVPPEFEDVSRKLAEIAATAYDYADYAQVRQRLGRLLLTVDSIANRFAVRDVTIQQTRGRFGDKQEKFPAADELLSEVDTVLKHARVSEVARLRELLDALGQWVSDALLKSASSGDALVSQVSLKAAVAEAAVYVNASFYSSALRGDMKTATTYHIVGVESLRRIFSDLRRFLRSSGVAPKDREDLRVPFDPGSVMIAAAVVADQFIPHLVVGLPTGGVHAANRIAGALLVRTRSAPVLWYTRPRGVKPSSKELMRGVREDDRLRTGEIVLLNQRLSGIDRLRILIVDDGAMSGGTFVEAKKMYAKTFRDGRPDVRSATVKGGRGVESDEFSGVVDYVMNQTDDRAGPRDKLFKTLPGDDPRAATQDPVVKVNTMVHVYSSDRGRSVELCKVLDP